MVGSRHRRMRRFACRTAGNAVSDACRIPRRRVRVASRGAWSVPRPAAPGRCRIRGAACVSRPVAPRGAACVSHRGTAWRRVRVASRHRVRVASRGAACVSYPAAPCPCPAAPRMRSRRRRAGAMSDACASEAAGRRLHTEGSDQNACMHVAAARGARRRATGGASLGEGDGSADPRVSDTGARAMAGARNHWSATRAVVLLGVRAVAACERAAGERAVSGEPRCCSAREVLLRPSARRRVSRGVARRARGVGRAAVLLGACAASDEPR